MWPGFSTCDKAPGSDRRPPYELCPSGIGLPRPPSLCLPPFASPMHTWIPPWRVWKTSSIEKDIRMNVRTEKKVWKEEIFAEKTFLFQLHAPLKKLGLEVPGSLPFSPESLPLGFLSKHILQPDSRFYYQKIFQPGWVHLIRFALPLICVTSSVTSACVSPCRLSSSRPVVLSRTVTSRYWSKSPKARKQTDTMSPRNIFITDRENSAFVVVCCRFVSVGCCRTGINMHDNT